MKELQALNHLFDTDKFQKQLSGQITYTRDAGSFVVFRNVDSARNFLHYLRNSAKPSQSLTVNLAYVMEQLKIFGNDLVLQLLITDMFYHLLFASDGVNGRVSFSNNIEFLNRLTETATILDQGLVDEE